METSDNVDGIESEAWEAIFYIVKEGKKYYAVFRHDNSKLNPITPCKHHVYAESLAFNWVHKDINKKRMAEIMIELTLMGKV